VARSITDGIKFLPGVINLGKYGSILEAVQDNLLAFLLGWLVGAGLAPMLVAEISALI
jgi:hypothetical protein